MHFNNEHARLAYCKYGDVVAQLTTLGPCPEDVPDGGPDTYAANFLQLSCGKPVLLISYCDRSAVKKLDNVIARTYKNNHKSPLIRAILRGFIFTNTLFYLFSFRPSHILCAASGFPS